MLKKTLTLSIIAGSILATPSYAEDRALLIGVGEYQNPKFNLPGIDLDINMMKKAAKLMGFDNVKTILNEQATLANVSETMESYLVKGTTSNDRILIYFSGHGTRIPDVSGDEPDKADEVLTMHDLRQTTINGKPSLAGVLLDDKLNAILKRMPSKNVLLLLDACNSGTATKGISLSRGVLGEGLATQPKTLHYAGMPPVSKTHFMLRGKPGTDNYVAISAAGDTESAQATSKGSLFTLGISSAINQATLSNSMITANTLKASATQFINRENTKKPFTPRLSGSDQLANKEIKLRASNTGYGETWKKLTKIADSASPLAITLNQKQYTQGDLLKITINNSHLGYLNVISIDPQDQATILFPNKFHPDGKVQGNITIPTKNMDFNLPTQEPFGNTLVVAFLTDQPLDLYKKGMGLVDGAGNIIDELHALSELGMKSITRAFGVEAKKSSKIKAGKVISLTCESKCN